MKYIPFVAFPRIEQDAVLGLLRQAGIAPQRVCVSRVEWAGAEPLAGATFTTVTAPGLCRSYRDGVDLDWIEALAQDLHQPAVRAG